MRRRLANYSGVAAGAGAVIEDDGRILRCFTVLDVTAEQFQHLVTGCWPTAASCLPDRAVLKRTWMNSRS